MLFLITCKGLIMPGKHSSKEEGDKTTITDPLLKKDLKLTDKPVLRSREEGDRPLFTDAMFNFVPGSSFEIGTSLAILDNPGIAGTIIDKYAQQVSKIVDDVYNTPVGNMEIVLNPSKPEQKITLKAYLDTKILKELNPASDQIGRCR